MVDTKDIEAILGDELDIVDSDKLTLHLLEILGGGGVGVQFDNRGKQEGVDFLRFGKTVELHMPFEDSGLHECGLIGIVAGAPLGIAELFETAVTADVETGEVNHHLLSDTIAEIEVVLVD